MRVSQTKIRNHINCPRQFYLEDVLGAKEPKDPNPKMTKADIGTLTHAGIDAYYRADAPWGDAILAKAADIASLKEVDDLQLFLFENTGSVVQAQTMASRYIAWVEAEGHDVHHGEPMTEYKFEFDLLDHTFTGVIDYVAWDEVMDAPIIIDHKTVAHVNQVPRPNDFQLTHYSWAYWKMTGFIPHSAGHNLIKRTYTGKGPYNRRVLININEQMLEHHEKKLVSELLRMNNFTRTIPAEVAAVMIPANFTKDCNWKCPVKDLCDVMDDPTDDWREMAETVYQIERSKLYGSN